MDLLFKETLYKENVNFLEDEMEYLVLRMCLIKDPQKRTPEEINYIKTALKIIKIFKNFKWRT